MSYHNTIKELISISVAYISILTVDTRAGNFSDLKSVELLVWPSIFVKLVQGTLNHCIENIEAAPDSSAGILPAEFHVEL
jgi:hypothetical protein